MTSAVFSPDDPVVFATGGAAAIRLWNVENPAHPSPLGRLRLDPGKAAVSLAFWQGRLILVSGDEGGAVRLWNVADPSHPAAVGLPLESTVDRVDSLACSLDGIILAVAGTGTVILWGLADQTPIPLGQPLVGDEPAVHSVTFSPDGQTMATGSADGTVILWDVMDPSKPTRLGLPLRAHSDRVTSITFSPKDPRIMATASKDNTVRLWYLADTTKPFPLCPALEDHKKPVNSIAIGLTGIMATGSDDQTVRLWDLPSSMGP